MKEKRILVWFRNDLRTHDNEVLSRALQAADGLPNSLIPVYCFDTRQFAPTSLGFPKTGIFRTQFLLQAVADLQQRLQALGSRLVLRVGLPEYEISLLARQCQVDAVYTMQEVTPEELAVEASLEAKLWEHKIALNRFWTSTLYHLEDLPYPVCNLPDIFTTFRKSVERQTKVRPLWPMPNALPSVQLPQELYQDALPTTEDLGLGAAAIPDERTAMPYAGGETAALERVREYFWQKNLLSQYKETRNGLIGTDYSSKFSAWLALGCLSPRYVYEEVHKYEYQIIQNDSTYWLVFELLWRDYFRFVAKKYGNRIFLPEGIRGDNALKMQKARKRFDKWVEGRCKEPFVDANMRELALTGFMSNRGRQNVASYLVKDLQVYWIWGAMYFESMLIDYDPCSNWGNWCYVAGVGNDPRENRYFNIPSQAKRYDPKGEYVRLWMPEIQHPAYH
jgi:deoxyribodipyrimidine photo-lyase